MMMSGQIGSRALCTRINFINLHAAQASLINETQIICLRSLCRRSLHAAHVAPAALIIAGTGNLHNIGAQHDTLALCIIDKLLIFCNIAGRNILYICAGAE